MIVINMQKCINFSSEKQSKNALKKAQKEAEKAAKKAQKQAEKAAEQETVCHSDISMQ